MHSHNVKFYFKENEDKDSASESEEENQEMSHPNSTSSAEEDARKMPYDLLQCFMNAKIHNHTEMLCHCNCRLWDGKPCTQQFDDCEHNKNCIIYINYIWQPSWISICIIYAKCVFLKCPCFLFRLIPWMLMYLVKRFG